MFAASKTKQVSSTAVFVEDVMSTYLYTGNGSTQTITNGIDLSGKGGLVFFKDRTNGGTAWSWVDTARGIYQTLESQNTGAQTSRTTGLTAFNTTGFNIGSYFDMNTSAVNYASWTFRKQPKFFDVVTYTGNGVAGRQIAHSLGSTPGCFIIKRTDTTGGWVVLHRGTTNPLQNFLYLDTTQAADTGTIGTGADSTTFTVTAGSAMNANGGTYVAYLFAHNAGGFGLTGTDNVISCGSYTGNGGATGPTVTLGYEPQWLLVKKSSGAQDWFLFDNMRGVATDGDDYYLLPNSSNAETTGGNTLDFTATGFVPKGAFDLNTSGTYIYIAIRRGPMKTPTSGTSVFSPVTRTGTGANTTTVAGFPVDMGMTGNRGAVASKFGTVDRLRGAPYLITSATAAEVTDATVYQANPFDTQTALKIGTTSAITNASGNTYVDHLFRRAPGFFDVVCYTGTGSATTQSHNLGVVPELMIVKPRSAVNGWSVYAASQGANKYLFLDTTAATATATTLWNNTTPTSSVFSVGVANLTNQSGQTFVAYLFATVAGVSKVGSYTGTGALQTVNCGFTSGARFVLIKRTDSTGDWYVYDSSRGITSGNDPYLLLNSTAAEATATNYVDTDTTGFKVTAAAPAGLNASGGTYIFLAIA